MRRKKLLYLLAGTGIVVFVSIYLIYRSLFSVTISPLRNRQEIFIPTGSTYEQVLDTLRSNLRIKKPAVLDWVARRKNYPGLIKPGRYIVGKHISCNGLINLLRSGRQSPVRITFSNIRTLNQIAGRFGRLIEADSSHLMRFLEDDLNYQSDGFSKETIISLFIPNTYEMYWNTSPAELYKKMLNEYRKFWNDEKLEKAKEKNLSPSEVAILASIIDDEVSKPDEKPRIAGVYLNRLKRGIPLQACPTIKFALNDFTITRVLYKHLQIDSPYNTYKHSGFPPGPIGCPSVEGLNAVLNAEKHDYLFFAAKADFSGYHNFSRTLAEHNRYAAIYQRELNKRRIFK
jgi:UPF0755 protein